MNLEKLKELLVKSNILVHDKSKNFICRCPYCKDHPNPKKQGHLWISKNSELPIGHCFYCNGAWPISKIITDITGDKSAIDGIIDPSEQNNFNKKTNIPKHSKERYRPLKLPNTDGFEGKKVYINKRTNNLISVDKVPNLVLDFNMFFKINNLDMVGSDKQLSNNEFDLFQRKFIGFLSNHNTTLYCRNTDNSDKYLFKKIILQEDPYAMLDYYSINGDNPKSNTIVLAEGNFNILGEYLTDSLNIRNDVKIYASGNGMTYGSLIKSVCFDNNLYQTKVIILSDNDKKLIDYRKIIKESEHLVTKIEIYYNKSGKDFGVFPIIPIKLF
jgi:hypothetical protein